MESPKTRKKALLLAALLVLSSSAAIGQKLKFKTLIKLQKSDKEGVDKYLKNRGWILYSADEKTDDGTPIVKWGFNVHRQADANKDWATAWLYLYLFEGNHYVSYRPGVYGIPYYRCQIAAVKRGMIKKGVKYDEGVPAEVFEDLDYRALFIITPVESQKEADVKLYRVDLEAYRLQ